jgi:biopolymer transport protein ExbB
MSPAEGRTHDYRTTPNEELIMTIVESSKDILLRVGASPIMYLMIALSIVSLAIMLDRTLLFFSLRENVARLAMELSQRIHGGDIEGARKLVGLSRSPEAAIVSAGLQQSEHGPEAAAEAMASASVLQRMRLERRLAFLGTLGNNAPFIGLLGTVIGIVQAFQRLEEAGRSASAGPSSAVMGSIAEALVATAFGLVVAIPAVAAFNYFQRQIKSKLGNAEALSHIVLSYLKRVKRESDVAGFAERARDALSRRPMGSGRGLLTNTSA